MVSTVGLITPNTRLTGRWLPSSYDRTVRFCEYCQRLTLSVVSLSLFPALVNREVERAHFLKSAASSSTMSFRSDDPAVPLSFSSRLVAVIADEFNYLLHWDLPISTVVHFNETGEHTHQLC